MREIRGEYTLDTLGIRLDQSARGNKRLTFKTSEFFKSVGKIVIKLASGSYVDAATEIPDLAASIGMSASPEERLGILVIRAMERTLANLLRDLEGVSASELARAASFVGLSEEFSCDIDSRFFEAPGQSGIIAAILPDIQRWLSAVGLSEADTRNILTRVPSIFATSLHNEWRNNSTFYAEIAEAIESPFLKSAALEQDWIRYRTGLISLVDESVFNESFSLRQIYVSPRAYYEPRAVTMAPPDKEFPTPDHNDNPLKQLVWLDNEIKQWISLADRDSPIKVITGGPGSGKSSFAKVLSSELSRDGIRTLFVPLHQIDFESGLTKSIGDYFVQTGSFSDNPIDRNDHSGPLILILDGLDEIQMQGKAAQEAARNLVDDLIRFVDRRNANSCRILCVVTGRDLAVQSAEGAFRKESQILHVCPYNITTTDRPGYADKTDLIDLDQRDEWWRKYGELKGRNFSGAPAELKRGEIDEVTSQPLLNYLVALSYQRGVVIDENTNINTVYGDLLKAVYDRGWARHNHPTIKDVSFDAFVRLLEEVALAVWHGAGRTTTLAEVEAHCQQSKVGALLPNFQTGVSGGVSSLLLAFYFRQKGRRSDGEKTFEFTHKTFAEYLTSLRIIRAISLISDQSDLHLTDPDVGLDDQDALHRWMLICGQTPLDTYLLEFIFREIALRGRETALKWQLSLTRLLNISLRTNWPVARIEGLKFPEQIQQVRNSEETLLACLNGCARTTELTSLIDWPSPISFGAMLKRLSGQRQGPQNKLVMDCLSYISADRQRLDISDLYSARLNNCSFISAELNYAMMMLTDLRGTDLTGASIDGANLSSARLSGAKISLRNLIRIQDWSSLRPNIDDISFKKTSDEKGKRTFIEILTQYINDEMLTVVDDLGAPMSDDDLINEHRIFISSGRRSEGD